jgi:hypothetical protein
MEQPDFKDSLKRILLLLFFDNFMEILAKEEVRVWEEKGTQEDKSYT